jgi:hypothetical protein
MKKLIVLTVILGTYFNIYAKSNINYPGLQLHFIYPLNEDSVKLLVDGNHAFYQKTVFLDSNITVSTIYIRAIQFMASKNITQTYGYQEEGRLIFSTFQDLNINKVYVGDENEILQTYSVQFAITLDIKNKRYRYTIHNVLFFIPTEYGNRRETMFELYKKATNTDSRRIAKEAKKIIESFERYINLLTDELKEEIEHKSPVNKPGF